jgi:hypothetical protein
MAVKTVVDHESALACIQQMGFYLKEQIKTFVGACWCDQNTGRLKHTGIAPGVPSADNSAEVIHVFVARLPRPSAPIRRRKFPRNLHHRPFGVGYMGSLFELARSAETLSRVGCSLGSRTAVFGLLGLVPAVPPLLAPGMTRSDDRACGGVPRHGSYYSPPCRTSS